MFKDALQKHFFFQDHVEGFGPTDGEGSGSESLRRATGFYGGATRLGFVAQKQEGGGILLDPDRPGVNDGATMVGVGPAPPSAKLPWKVKGHGRL